MPDYLSELRHQREEEEKSQINSGQTPSTKTHNRKKSMFQIRERARKLDATLEEKEHKIRALGGNIQDEIQCNNILIESLETKLDMLRKINIL